MTVALILLHVALCLVLIYSVFVRFVRTDASVRIDVRLAFWLLGLAACLAVPAPLFGYVPRVLDLLLLAAFAAVQHVTGRHWTRGVPRDFYQPGCAPRNRVCDGQGGRCCNEDERHE